MILASHKDVVTSQASGVGGNESFFDSGNLRDKYL
jgi:hypothetical protein